jgi:glycerol-3-phosphate cytidylyltransferase
MTKYKTIITYGTFDLFHIGHLNLLERLKGMCDELIVAVSTDEFNELKGKKTLIPFEQRIKIIRSIKYVNKAIPENNWEQKKLDIKKYNVSAFAIGDDWKGEFDDLKEYCEVIYLERTKDISSTALKKSLKNFLSVSPQDLKIAFEVLSQLKQDLE